MAKQVLQDEDPAAAARQALLDQLGPDNPAEPPAGASRDVLPPSGGRNPVAQTQDEAPPDYTPNPGAGEPGGPPMAPPAQPAGPAPPPITTQPVPPISTGPAQPWRMVNPGPGPAPAPTSGAASPTPQYLLDLINSGLSPQDAIAQFNAATGRKTGNEAVFYGAGAHGANDLGTIGLPSAYLAKQADGSWTITQRGAEGGGAAPSGLSGSNATAYGAGPGGDPGISGYNQWIRDFMTKQLGVLSGPTDENSPDVAPALSAFNTQSHRDQQTARDALAERYYASGEGGTGLQSGGFNTAVAQGMESAAGNRANFAGTTIYNAAQAKRNQLQEMLATASANGLTTQAQQIQMQIAEIDRQLRQQSITNQDRQTNDRLGYDYTALQAQANRDALLAAAGK